MEKNHQDMDVYHTSPLWRIAMFSMNNAATGIYMAMIAYVSYYANSIAGFGVVLISVIITVLNVVNGFTDPVVGFFLDKTDGKFGKFRPFIVFGNVLMAVSTFLLFFVTHHIPGLLRMPYFIIVYGLFMFGYTFQTTAGNAGPTVMTNNPKQRPMATYFDSIFIMAAYGLTALYFSNYLIPRYGGFEEAGVYEELAVVVIIISALATICSLIGIWKKDKKEYFGISKVSQKIKARDYWDIFRHNKPIRMLIFAGATTKFSATVYSNTTIGVMLFGILMHDYSIAGIIGLVTAIPTLFVVTAGIKTAQRFGQKTTMIIFTWAGVVFQLILVLIFASKQVENIRMSIVNMNLISLVFFVIFVLLNGCRSLTNNLTYPMVADCSDYEVYRSGKYVPGIMGSLFTFIDKVIAAFGTTFVGLILAFFGYDKTLPQISDPTTAKIRWITIFMYCIVPAIGWIFSIWALNRYDLDKTKMQEIQYMNQKIKAKYDEDKEKENEDHIY